MIEAQSVLSNIVAQVSRGNSRVLLEESGIPIAAIVSVDDLEQLNQFERRREAFFAKVDRLQEAFKDVPPAEIEQETDRIIARNRAADRSAREETAAAR
jgi:antitoxin (DNA-binding transcriptional repressor) of toxin-antitoxin stability system